MNDQKNEIEELKNKLLIAIDALELYAEKSHWCYGEEYYSHYKDALSLIDTEDGNKSPDGSEYGALARKALKQIREIK